mmetsp:Transcript_13527/g.43152  ORF Transcript_13527/g.43152 Transcript_13527/m.43152 type:complete len:250 (+) Transcript_13527:184-933(+)
MRRSTQGANIGPESRVLSAKYGESTNILSCLDPARLFEIDDLAQAVEAQSHTNKGSRALVAHIKGAVLVRLDIPRRPLHDIAEALKRIAKVGLVLVPVAAARALHDVIELELAREIGLADPQVAVAATGELDYQRVLPREDNVAELAAVGHHDDVCIIEQARLRAHSELGKIGHELGGDIRCLRLEVRHGLLHINPSPSAPRLALGVVGVKEERDLGVQAVEVVFVLVDLLGEQAQDVMRLLDCAKALG